VTLAARLPPASSDPVVDAAAWSTPRRLRFYQLLVWGLVALLFLAGEGTLNRARSALKTIGKDTAPSILAAQEISATFADLDANAANYLIGSPIHRVEAMKAFELRRVHATTRLVEAAENITYGEAEKAPILDMITELGRYLEVFAEARYRYDSGDVRGAADTYRLATTLMHGKILNAARQLDQANRAYLDDAYAEQERASGGAEGIAVVVGGGLIVVLLWLQLFLLRRMRRIVNPPIAMATGLAVFFTVYLINAFGAARADLRVAKEHAFESLHALSKARAVAFDTRGDESRYLLDRQNAQVHEAAFMSQVRELTTDPGMSARTKTEMQRRGVTFDGLFAYELKNATFDGEWEAAEKMLRAFAVYYRVDQRIRALETSGKHEAAVQVCIGSEPDASNVTFDRFDQALRATVQINRAAFDRALEEGDRALKRTEVLDPAVAIAIALLTWFGLRARIREYD